MLAFTPMQGVKLTRKKNQHCKGRVTKKKITGGKTKLAYIAGRSKPIYPTLNSYSYRPKCS
jgi:hypothetical protein